MAIKDAKNGLKNLDAESKALITLLIFGIKKFYKQDSEALFGHGDSPRHIDERAMVGCIYRYMYQGLAKRCVNFSHIDIEYNRMLGLKTDGIEKAIVPCEKCKREGASSVCIAKDGVFQQWLTDLKSQKDYKGIRPDIIVHNRNQLNRFSNGLIVEFKKLDGDLTFDEQKVRYATCHYSRLHYIVGAVVRLKQNNAEVEVYQNGKPKCKFLVSQHGLEN